MRSHQMNPEVAEVAEVAPEATPVVSNVAVWTFLQSLVPNGLAKDAMPFSTECLDRVRWDVVCGTSDKYNGTYEDNSSAAEIKARGPVRDLMLAAIATDPAATVQTKGSALHGQRYLDLLVSKAAEVLPHRLYKIRKTAKTVAAGAPDEEPSI